MLLYFIILTYFFISSLGIPHHSPQSHSFPSLSISAFHLSNIPPTPKKIKISRQPLWATSGPSSAAAFSHTSPSRCVSSPDRLASIRSSIFPTSPSHIRLLQWHWELGCVTPCALLPKQFYLQIFTV